MATATALVPGHDEQRRRGSDRRTAGCSAASSGQRPRPGATAGCVPPVSLYWEIRPPSAVDHSHHVDAARHCVRLTSLTIAAVGVHLPGTAGWPRSCPAHRCTIAPLAVERFTAIQDLAAVPYPQPVVATTGVDELELLMRGRRRGQLDQGSTVGGAEDSVDGQWPCCAGETTRYQGDRCRSWPRTPPTPRATAATATSMSAARARTMPRHPRRDTDRGTVGDGFLPTGRAPATMGRVRPRRGGRPG